MDAMSIARLSLRSFRSSANNACLSGLIDPMETANLLVPLFSSRSNLLHLSQAALEVESRQEVIRLERQRILAARKDSSLFLSMMLKGLLSRILRPSAQWSEDSQNKLP